MQTTLISKADESKTVTHQSKWGSSHQISRCTTNKEIHVLFVVFVSPQAFIPRSVKERNAMQPSLFDSRLLSPKSIYYFLFPHSH